MGWMSGWAWIVAGLVSLPALPHPHHQGELSGIVLASLPYVAMGKVWGGLPAFTPSGLAHPYILYQG